MRSTFIIAVALAVVGCSQPDAATPSRNESDPTANNDPQPAGDSSTVDPKREMDEHKNASSIIKPLTAEQQEQLLAARLDGGMGYSFRQFANMFLVSSRIQFGTGIGLMTSDKEIAEVPLQSPFPASYKPTLGEFLDAIALQTFSEWKYDPSSKYFESEVDHEAPVEGLAIFEFTKTKREKRFAVTLPDGWKTIDKGNWVMHVPPSFPVGMDIYEMGTYSSDEEVTQEDFASKIRSAVALEWAQRVNEKAKQEDLKPAKVGIFDALFYESMIPSQLDKEIRWRQWVFIANNKCYFIVSTILPEHEDEIIPDVQKMVASFRIKTE